MTITRTVTLGRAVPCSCHVCAFFSYSGDEDKVVLPFIREGLHTGDKTVCILDRSLRSERLRRLSGAGFDTADAEASGQLDVRSWENAPLQPARFDRDFCNDRAG
jgi:enoyl-CoA hydratase/carnithine racemase